MDTPESQPFRDFLEAVPDAVVVVDTSGSIIFVNQQTEVIFGYTRDELVGEQLEVLVPDRNKEAHPHHRAIYSLAPVKRPMGIGLDLAGRKKGGLEFPVDIALSTVTLNDRTLVLAAVRDMSDRKKYEAALITDLTEKVAGLTETAKIPESTLEALLRSNKWLKRFAIGFAISLFIDAILTVSGIFLLLALNDVQDTQRSVSCNLYSLLIPSLQHPDPEQIDTAEKRKQFAKFSKVILTDYERLGCN